MVERKETYDDLPKMQRAIIDAKAKHPDKPNTEIANELDTNRSYVSQVVNANEHILNERVEALQSTEPIYRSTDAQTQRVEAIADELAAQEGTTEIDLTITRDDLLALVRGEVPQRIRDEILEKFILSARFDSETN